MNQQKLSDLIRVGRAAGWRMDENLQAGTRWLERTWARDGDTITAVAIAKADDWYAVSIQVNGWTTYLHGEGMDIIDRTATVLTSLGAIDSLPIPDPIIRAAVTAVNSFGGFDAITRSEARILLSFWIRRNELTHDQVGQVLSHYRPSHVELNDAMLASNADGD